MSGGGVVGGGGGGGGVSGGEVAHLSPVAFGYVESVV